MSLRLAAIHIYEFYGSVTLIIMIGTSASAIAALAYAGMWVKQSEQLLISCVLRIIYNIVCIIITSLSRLLPS